MRTILMSTIAGLALVACSEDTMSDAEEAMDEAGEEMAEAANDMADTTGDMVDDAMDNAEADMDEMGDAMTVRDVDGTWGITQMACSEDNSMRDGVILISRYDIMVGLDQCSITGADQTEDGFTRFTADCEGGEGDSYSAAFEFVATEDGTLVWNNNGRMEEYVRCEG